MEIPTNCNPALVHHAGLKSAAPLAAAGEVVGMVVAGVPAVAAFYKVDLVVVVAALVEPVAVVGPFL